MVNDEPAILWSPRSSKAMKIAANHAGTTPGQGVGTLHLLLGLLEVRASAAGTFLRPFGIDHAAVNSRLAAGELQETSQSVSERWTEAARSVFRTAREWAEHNRCTVVTSELLLMAMMRTKCDARVCVSGLGADPEAVCVETLEYLGFSEPGASRNE